MVFEYFLVLLCFFICCLIAFLMVFISYSIIYQEVDYEKISAYECGFQPFDDARSKFDIKFYLVAILFIIFDLEVMFLFPWSICIFEITIFGHLTMFFFLFILTIGFIYEWRKGALDWN